MRIYENLKRKVHREEDSVKKEISYWSKVKDIEHKRHQSTKILPRLSNQGHELHNPIKRNESVGSGIGKSGLVVVSTKKSTMILM